MRYGTEVKRRTVQASMDGQMKVWRKLLHSFDPAVMEAKQNGTYVEQNEKNEAATAASAEEESASVAAAMDEDDDDGEMIEKASAAGSDDSFVIVNQ